MTLEGMDKIDMVMDTVIYIMDEDMVDMVIGYGGGYEHHSYKHHGYGHHGYSGYGHED